MGIYRDLCEDKQREIEDLTDKVNELKGLLNECEIEIAHMKVAFPHEDFTELFDRIDKALKPTIKIEDLECKLFKSMDPLKKLIRKNFYVEDMEELEYENSDGEIVKELAFCDDKYDYSLYYEIKNGGVYVEEYSCQYR